MTRPSERFAAILPRPTVNFLKQQVGRLVSWDLDALAGLWFTDKGPQGHAYTQHYARHLRRGRRQVKAVLEIGIGGYSQIRYGGHSLYMWRSYFPRATVYGLDLHQKRLESCHRIVVLQADQSDRDSLARTVANCPPLNLVVDDGSHRGADVIASFEVLFPLLIPGGIYAIEDLYCAYDPSLGGGPAGTPGTAIDLVKHMVDDLNLGRGSVAAIHHYPGLALIEKA